MCLPKFNVSTVISFTVNLFIVDLLPTVSVSTINWSSGDWHTVNRPICALSNYIQSICLLLPIVTTVCNGNIGFSLSYYSFFSQFNNSQSVLRQFVYSQFVKWKPKNSIYVANPFHCQFVRVAIVLHLNPIRIQSIWQILVSNGS